MMILLHEQVPIDIIPVYQWIVGILFGVISVLATVIVYLYKANIKASKDLSKALSSTSAGLEGIVHAIQLQNKDIEYIKECCKNVRDK